MLGWLLLCNGWCVDCWLWLVLVLMFMVGSSVVWVLLNSVVVLLCCVMVVVRLGFVCVMSGLSWLSVVLLYMCY